MQIPKDQILDLLRQQGKDDQVGEADQQLPDQVDTEQHAGLLEKFGLNPADLIGKLGGGGRLGESSVSDYASVAAVGAALGLGGPARRRRGRRRKALARRGRRWASAALAADARQRSVGRASAFHLGSFVRGTTEGTGSLPPGPARRQDRLAIGPMRYIPPSTISDWPVV